MTALGGPNVSEDTDRDSAGQVDSIVAGTNIDSIDNSDPANPVINAAAGAGETNTGSNLGAGEGSVFKTKNGVDFEHRTLKAGTNITITEDANEILIVAAGAAAATFSGALVTNTGSQTVNSTTSPLTWDAESYDEGGWHDTGTNPTRLTVPAGVAYVRITMNCRDTSSVSGQLNATLTKNGSSAFDGAVTQEIETAGGDAVNATTGVLAVIAGDYFEMEIFATTSRTTDAATTNFSIEKVA